jgi:hypothetical protein
MAAYLAHNEYHRVAKPDRFWLKQKFPPAAICGEARAELARVVCRAEEASPYLCPFDAIHRRSATPR